MAGVAVTASNGTFVYKSGLEDALAALLICAGVSYAARRKRNYELAAGASLLAFSYACAKGLMLGLGHAAHQPPNPLAA